MAKISITRRNHMWADNIITSTKISSHLSAADQISCQKLIWKKCFQLLIRWRSCWKKKYLITSWADTNFIWQLSIKEVVFQIFFLIITFPSQTFPKHMHGETWQMWMEVINIRSIFGLMSIRTLRKLRKYIISEKCRGARDYRDEAKFPLPSWFMKRLWNSQIQKVTLLQL